MGGRDCLVTFYGQQSCGHNRARIQGGKEKGKEGLFGFIPSPYLPSLLIRACKAAATSAAITGLRVRVIHM